MQLTDTEYAATAEKIARLNKRAAKRGWTGQVTITAERVEVRKHNAITGLDVVTFRNEVTISGEPPCYEGWTFLAKVDFDPEAGVIISTAPGVDSVDRSGLVEGACDHCQKDIASRRYVYLVRHEDGRQLQVGATCLKDFLGWSANPVFISSASLDEELAECWTGGGGMEERYAVETVLAASWACIQTFGWHSASMHDGNATKHAVAAVLDPRSPKERELAAEVRPHIPDAAAMATRIREFILSDDFKGDSEYVINLKGLARAESCPVKHFGLLVSAPQAWAKSVERDLRRQAEAEERNNTFAGAVKDKIEVTATVKSIRYLEGDYGTTTVYTLAGADGRIYQWFASRSALGDEVTGDSLKLKATVKRLDEYNGAKTTVLTRAKIIEAEAGA